MKLFAELFTRLDQTTKTLAKLDALLEYFEKAPDKDKLWAIAILSHRRPKRAVNINYIKEWACELSGLPYWLFEESYHVAGDLGETIALILPDPETRTDHSLTYWIDFISSLADLDEAGRKEQLTQAWLSLSTTERFVFNKLMMGAFRMGVSQKLMVRALSMHTGIEENILAHRLMGHWWPDYTTFEELILSEEKAEDDSRPYPFYLAYALDDPHEIGDPDHWMAERKWDGIRGQVIVRNDKLYVWSRGEELVTDKYPEYEIFRDQLPNGTVLDGEILPFKDEQPLPFNVLQTRIGRKNVTPAILKKAPVAFIAYDLLEWEGEDVRQWQKARAIGANNSRGPYRRRFAHFRAGGVCYLGGAGRRAGYVT
ncbi:ATP-dependent DNA ligase LigC [Fulvivirga imtechensis AK7]|uniref:ATP-dependent DNA ligase LigC n=1 Tax=Fulvivirga imtechensis AK7 TaxID=1237149 RepID=L8JJ11_9BACT|nr:ATP-dependent DNA ligase LigC [Fulvivirga imtechensis AK7]